MRFASFGCFEQTADPCCKSGVHVDYRYVHYPLAALSNDSRIHLSSSGTKSNPSCIPSRVHWLECRRFEVQSDSREVIVCEARIHEIILLTEKKKVLLSLDEAFNAGI